MNNLPNWNGASVVYSRAGRIATHLNEQAYTTQRAAAKGKRFRFSPDNNADAIIKAMNCGDEEALKAANHEYRHVWL